MCMQLLTHAIQSLAYKHFPGSPVVTTSSQAIAQFDVTNVFNAAPATMPRLQEPAALVRARGALPTFLTCCVINPTSFDVKT